MRRLPQRLTIPLTILLTTLFCLVLLPLLSSQRHDSLLFDSTTWRGRTRRPNPSRIARVTMTFNAEGDDMWERGIALQQRHADTHGYPLFVLRRELLPTYWSKPAYLLSIMLRECEKPEAERLQWLLYVIQAPLFAFLFLSCPVLSCPVLSCPVLSSPCVALPGEQ